MMERMNWALGKHTPAFTRLELLACLGVVALLTPIIGRVLAASGSRADRVACFNNLRQIGNAYIEFSLEHDGSPPWRVAPSEGGNNAAFGGGPDDPNKHELWYQFWWVRDSLRTPTILMDPAETRVNALVATSWERNVTNGFQTFKNNAVAYVLGLDSFAFLPGSILVADRNLVNTGVGGCSSVLNQATRLSRTEVRWANEIHGLIGNVARYDGSVDALNTDKLRRAVNESQESGPYVHVLGAQW